MANITMYCTVCGAQREIDESYAVTQARYLDSYPNHPGGPILFAATREIAAETLMKAIRKCELAIEALGMGHVL